MSDLKKIVFCAEHAGQRLDHALASFFPELGLRGRRRLLKNSVFMGKPARGGQRLAVGDVLVLPSAPPVSGIPWQPFLLKITDGYCFFIKPPGLHTESLAGDCGITLERHAAVLLPDCKPVLLQRLDQLTSGIVCAALDERKAAEFRKLENSGKCRKYYLTLLNGVLERDIVCNAGLDVANRRKTAILKSPANKLGSTCFSPLHVWRGACPLLGNEAPHQTVTLAMACIHKGKRHQIRAHAAVLGYPLYGDGVYGSGSGSFFLEHFALFFPGRQALFVGEHSLYSRLDVALQKKAGNLMQNYEDLNEQAGI